MTASIQTICAVMDKMHIPPKLIDTIFALFYDTSVNLNINGHLARTFQQRRGLGQGDPFPPLRFNIAIEPFLQTVVACLEIEDFSMSEAPTASPLKNMAYADNLAAFIHSRRDWTALKVIMKLYGRNVKCAPQTQRDGHLPAQ